MIGIHERRRVCGWDSPAARDRGRGPDYYLVGVGTLVVADDAIVVEGGYHEALGEGARETESWA